MNNFWEERYIAGGNSGAGSYGEYAIHKAEVINNYVSKYDIKTISDFGCGDGNQISLLNGYESYMGYDVASYALFLCQKKFSGNTKMHFCSLMSDLPKADLCLSLDVLYHIIDEKEFEKYLLCLFEKSKKFVLIFSSNHKNNNHDAGNYIKHRKFTEWINENVDFKLVEVIDNDLETSAKFYLYERNVE
jgi:2-polyprenyl-3-methyl-5-hydroxy-6-metoxy-1,4-benzoquinol methylase